jgi:hypothetical protein
MDDLDLYVQLNGVELLEQIEQDSVNVQKTEFINSFESKFTYCYSFFVFKYL